jgi:hypothetical protein
MSRNADIELPYPDKLRKFRLGIGQLRALQERCNAGPAKIYRRLQEGDWLVDDVLETIRQGAIGGGAKLDEAVVLMKDVESRPIAEAVQWALIILGVGLAGVSDESFDPRKDGDAEKTKTGMSGSTSSTSTETEPSSGGRPASSMN